MKRGRVPSAFADSPGLFRWQGQPWGAPGPEEGVVVVEAPLEIAVGDALVAILMRTPGLDRELAVGYCLGEGIVPNAEAIESVETDGGEVAQRVTLRLRPGVSVDAEKLSKPRFIRSGCAANTPGDWACTVPPLGAGAEVADSALRGSLKLLAAAQEAYKVAGGIHAAGVFSASGEAVVVCEDIGRHNAVDKALGACVLRGIPLGDKFLLGTGRASYEFVTKSARLGVSLVASLSSPTSLSVQLADVLNQTLVGYVRPRRFVVYTHPWRIRRAEP
ncbi:MAG: formate dehydrogenase accessory sulfurtransferase FdhD [Anaerolineae bacterium]|nr:formate dehydrogenase accessory sulfurtransferase FdhD [Anaerolineae bacterium]